MKSEQNSAGQKNESKAVHDGILRNDYLNPDFSLFAYIKFYIK